MNKLSLCRGAARRDVQTGWGNRSGWSDLRCLLCRSIVQSWNSPLPKPSVGWCSWCFKRCDQVYIFTSKSIVVFLMVCDIIDQVLLKESVFGSDVLTCSSCQHHTRKCTSCSDGFAWGNGILNSLQCAVCVGCVRSWSCLESPAVSEVSAICSWCLQKSFHHLIEKNTFRRSVYSFPQHFNYSACHLCLLILLQVLLHHMPRPYPQVHTLWRLHGSWWQQLRQQTMPAMRSVSITGSISHRFCAHVSFITKGEKRPLRFCK